VINNVKESMAGASGKLSVDDFFEAVRFQQIAKLFDHRVRLYVALEALMEGNMDAKAVNDKKRYINRCISQASMSPPDVLWAFNTFLHANPGSAKGFAMVLKVVYDEDWADEQSILRFYQNDEDAGEPGFEEAKKAAGPFLTWLENAASDDDDDDSDSDSD